MLSSNNEFPSPNLEHLPHDILCHILSLVTLGKIEGIPLRSSTELDHISRAAPSLWDSFRSPTFWSSICLEIRSSDLVSLELDQYHSWQHLGIQRLQIHWPSEGSCSYRWHIVCQILARNFNQLHQIEIHDDDSFIVPSRSAIDPQHKPPTSINFPLSPANLTDQLCYRLISSSSQVLQSLQISSKFSCSTLPNRPWLFPRLPSLHTADIIFIHPSYFLNQLIDSVLSSPVIKSLNLFCSSCESQLLRQRKILTIDSLQNITCNLGGLQKLINRRTIFPLLNSLFIKLDDDHLLPETTENSNDPDSSVMLSLFDTFSLIGKFLIRHCRFIESLHITGCWQIEGLQSLLLNCLFPSRAAFQSLETLDLSCCCNVVNWCPEIRQDQHHAQNFGLQSVRTLFDKISCPKLKTLCLQSALLPDLISFFVRNASVNAIQLCCLCIQQVSTPIKSSIDGAAELQDFAFTISQSSVTFLYVGRLSGCLSGMNLNNLLMATENDNIYWTRETHGMHQHNQTFSVWCVNAAQFYWKKNRSISPFKSEFGN